MVSRMELRRQRQPEKRRVQVRRTDAVRQRKPETSKKIVEKVQRRPEGLLGRLFDIKTYINQHTLEREEETVGMILAVLSGTSFFLFGSYGTSKTRQIREMASLFGMREFDVLISESTKPEAIFGPDDIPALAKGIQRRKTDGYAPTAHWLFFDEQFRASGVVLNPLRWLINEKIYRNGDEGLKATPTRVVSGASNEIPTEPELLADYDRMLLRYKVHGLASPRSIDRMIDLRLNPQILQRPRALTLAETDRLIAMRAKVDVPAEIRKLAIRVRDQVHRATAMVVSDRRFADSMTVIQANALMNGRMKATADDVGVLAHILWDKPEHIPKVRAIAAAAASHHGADLVSFEEVAGDVWTTAMETGDMESAEKKLAGLLESVASLSSEVGRTVQRTIQGYLHRVRQILRDRKEFVLIEMPSNKHNGFIYKLATNSATSWTATQLRSVGFHWYKHHSYWWHDGCRDETKLAATRNKLGRDITKALKVVPRIRRLQQ